MASFRTGIKIISDVSKRQGWVLLQRSVSAEHLLALRGRQAASDARSSSPPGPKTSDEEPQNMTDTVATDKPWFSNFVDRQDKEAQVVRPKQRKLAQPQSQDATPTKNKFLVPIKGPQVPNRYFSSDYDYCKKDPPERFVGPPASLRNCPKTSKPCFIDMFKPQVVEIKRQEISRVDCGHKKDTNKFCDNKSAVKPFLMCPKPLQRVPVFKCPEAPKIQRPPKKIVIPRCEQHIPPPFRVCPKPPSKKILPMCLVLSGKFEEQASRKPKPPPTPRRCLCPNDPELSAAKQPPPLYKMNPEIPFPVCPKRKIPKKPYVWASTNQECKGQSGGICMSCDGQMPKSPSCKSIRGGPCVEEHACPYHKPKPPPPPPTCGPVSRPAFPTGSEDSFTLTQSAPPPTITARRELPSSTAEPTRVQSLTNARTTASSSTSSPRSLSASACAPRTTSSITSLPKQSGSAKAVSVSQPSKPSSKTSTAMAFNVSTKLDCKKLDFNRKKDKVNSGHKCAKLRMPGCPAPVRTDCTKINPKRKCIKKQPPRPCFSDCYKRPCPPKVCSPCPCVVMSGLTECDIKLKTRHLQPKEPIFIERRPFILPPPVVELFVDPLIAACCEASQPKPEPLPMSMACAPKEVKPCAPAPVPTNKEEKSKGCDCSFVNFFRSLLGFLKGEDKCPTPTEKVKKAAQQIQVPCEEEEPSCSTQPKTASQAIHPACRDIEPRGKDPRGKKKKKSLTGICPHLKLPGCPQRLREDCTYINPDTNCKKRLAPRPSFSECMRDDFPLIRCTECRIALKRAKSLSELRDRGIRVTPENLRVHCSMCLNPTTKGCEIISAKKLDCFKSTHHCRLGTCTRMGLTTPKKEKEKPKTKNPPRPTRDYCGPRSEPKKCDKPPAVMKKDCKNVPPRQEPTKNLPCNPLVEEPPKIPPCDLENPVCEALEPYRIPVPKEDCEK